MRARRRHRNFLEISWNLVEIIGAHHVMEISQNESAAAVEASAVRPMSASSSTSAEADMRTIILAFSLVTFSLLTVAANAQQAPRNSAPRNQGSELEKRCHDQVGKEQPESEGRSHIGQMQVQRFSDCMQGR